MPIIENNTFKFDEQGNLIPVGEVTGTIDQTGSSNGQDGTAGVPGTPATPGVGGGGDYNPLDQNKTPDYQDGTQTEQRAGDIPAGGVGVSVVPETNEPGTPATPGIGGGGDYNPLDQNKTPDYQKGAQTEQRAGDIPAGGVGVSVVPETNETINTNGIVPTKPIVSPYSNGIDEAIKNNPNIALKDHIGAYNQWATENGQAPLDIFQIYDLIQGKDPNKSAAQNIEDEKKAKRRERFEQAGNFLSHLGNFVGTLYGSPNQETLESATSLSKRQQDLKDKTMALRQQQWQDTYRSYKDKLDAEIAKQNADLAMRKEARLDAESKARIAKNEAYTKYQEASTNKKNEEAAYWKAKYEALEAGLPLEEALKKAKIASEKARANSYNSQANKNNTAANKNDDNVTEVTEYERDADGNVKKSTKTKTKATEQKTEKIKVTY